MSLRKSPHLLIENLNEEPLDLSKGYSLNEFSKIASARYNIPFYTLRKVLSDAADDLSTWHDGVVVDSEGMKRRRVYIMPSFSRYFIYEIVERLRSGVPISIVFKHKSL